MICIKWKYDLIKYDLMIYQFDKSSLSTTKQTKETKNNPFFCYFIFQR